MNIRSLSLFFAAIFATSLLTWYATRLYYVNIISSRVEDIITQEVALLEQVKGHNPPCERISDSGSLFVENLNGWVIIWKKSQDSKEIEKLVVNDSFNSAYEKIDNVCQ